MKGRKRKPLSKKDFIVEMTPISLDDDAADIDFDALFESVRKGEITLENGVMIRGTKNGNVVEYGGRI